MPNSEFTQIPKRSVFINIIICDYLNVCLKYCRSSVLLISFGFFSHVSAKKVSLFSGCINHSKHFFPSSTDPESFLGSGGFLIFFFELINSSSTATTFNPLSIFNFLLLCEVFFLDLRPKSSRNFVANSSSSD